MNQLDFTERFEKTFSKLRDAATKKEIWNKILELETRAPIGKKLRGHPFWSLHVNRFRVIYRLEGSRITVIELLARKHEYRDL